MIELIEMPLPNNLAQKLQNGNPLFITDVGSLLHWLISHLRTQSEEAFVGLFLDHQSQRVTLEPLFVGSVDHAMVEPDEPLCYQMLGPILRHETATLICAHYCPEGDGRLKPIDYSVGQWLTQTFAVVDMQMLAYLVISQTHCVNLYSI